VYDYNNGCMQMAGIPSQSCPFMSMPQQQLEAMYPKTYQIIQPVVDCVCDDMMVSYGQALTPTNEQLESMVDNVYTKVELDIDIAIKQSSREEERQFYGSGRRLLRDFIRTLLIAGLIRRIRPYPLYPGYPGYYGYPSPGYYDSYGPYGGFPVY
jgi:hypothetical protein